MSDQQGNAFQMDGLQTMGIINALKTGDVRLDMLIAMCIPILLRYLFGLIERSGALINWQGWMEWWRRSRKEKHQRYLVYRTTRNYWGSTTSIDNDTQNTILIKAVQLYLHYKCKLGLKTADLDLTSMEGSTSGLGYYGGYDYDDDDRSSRTLVGMLSKYEIVKKPPKREWHDLGEHDGSKVELKIMEEEEEEDGDGEKKKSSQKTTLTFHFVSEGGTSIDCFIDKAYKWYMDQLRKMEDYSRYMYELTDLSGSSDDDDGGSGGGFTYARYKLSEEKTFDSLFFRQKESLVNWVNHFQNKTGKYAIKGYPHKMGLLLHGPPGTGKTSLIKALAQHTGRSIVNVSLAKISTNAELMSIFFDKKFYIQGEGIPVKLGFKDVIFVMEDIDAASKIVKRRDGKQSRVASDVTKPEHIEMPIPKSMWRMLLESNDSDCQKLFKLLMEKSNRLKTEAQKADILVGISNRMMTLPGLGFVGEDYEAPLSKIGENACQSANDLMTSYSTVDKFLGTHAKTLCAMIEAGTEINDEFVDKMLGRDATGMMAPPPARSKMVGLSRDVSYTKTDKDMAVKVEDTESALMENLASMMMSDAGTGSDSKTSAGVAAGPSPFSLFKKKDQLNLTGLLNVLDGVVDTPGRIVIMTTNHPEMLDPALIRPGRIDKKLMLGYMSALDVVEMLEHYFECELTDEQHQRVLSAVGGNPSKGTAALNLTPAQVEQMTAESDEIEDMIRVLEEKGSFSMSRMPAATISASTLKYNL